jgi:energy-coupling factor transporter ATP-binding protein EcfA2
VLGVRRAHAAGRHSQDAELPRARARGARRVAIDHKLASICRPLSHGEHRQVALAVALAAEPGC